MPNARANARSSRRDELPLELRVYGLEGITTTQDEAITRQGVTLAEHDDQLGDHATALAVLTTQVTALVIALAKNDAGMTKVMWTLIGFAFTVAAAALGVVIKG